MAFVNGKLLLGPRLFGNEIWKKIIETFKCLLNLPYQMFFAGLLSGQNYSILASYHMVFPEWILLQINPLVNWNLTECSVLKDLTNRVSIGDHCLWRYCFL